MLEQRVAENMPTGQLKKLRHPAQLGPAPQPLFGGEQPPKYLHRHADTGTHTPTGDRGYTVSENFQWPMGAAAPAADHTVALGAGHVPAHGPCLPCPAGQHPPQHGSCSGGTEGLALTSTPRCSLQLHHLQSPTPDTEPIAAAWAAQSLQTRSWGSPCPSSRCLQTNFQYQFSCSSFTLLWLPRTLDFTPTVQQRAWVPNSPKSQGCTAHSGLVYPELV